MCYHARRGCKAMDICGHIEGLDNKLRVLAGGIAPSTYLDIHLAVILVASRIVPREKIQHNRRIHMRCVTHHERVGPVSKTTSEDHFCTGPLVCPLRYSEMKGTGLIRPRIRGVIDVESVPTTAGSVADAPFISAEVESRRH